MKKKLVAAALLLTMLLSVTGCGNKQMVDMVYKYDRAIVCLPNGEVVEGEVDSWTDYEDGDQIQVKIDGVYYLVHSENVVLIAE